MRKNLGVLGIVVALVLAMLPSGGALYAADAPMVEVYDHVLHDGMVVVKKVVAAEAGWIVIHAGSEGFPVIGQTYVPAGTTEYVTVAVDVSRATQQMSAMLHVDKGIAGIYEFPGEDVPVRDANNQIVNPAFNVLAVQVDDQFVSAENTVTIGTVVAQEDGWIVIHADSQGFPAIGHAAIKAGVNKDVVVSVDPSMVTARMSAMIHVDRGTIGTYEFPGADVPPSLAGDLPRLFGGGISNEGFVTVESVRAAPMLMGSDGVVTVPAALIKEDGWMVIHATSEGAPVIGYAPLKAGLNKDIQVEVDMAMYTTGGLLAMLHADAGTVGTYEFPGADVPLRDAAGQIIAPRFSTYINVTVSDQQLVAVGDATYVIVESVSAVQDGWMVIHATSEGAPVIGAQFVPMGVHKRIIVRIDAAMATDALLAMLHVDEGTRGVYEFPGPDVPVRVDDQVVAPRFNATK